MTTTANPTEAMADAPTFPWWLVLLEGIFVGIFGLLLFTAPAASLLFLVQAFGFYLFIGASSDWSAFLLTRLLGAGSCSVASSASSPV